jgi:uroporphyrinogen-III decarboxylase
MKAGAPWARATPCRATWTPSRSSRRLKFWNSASQEILRAANGRPGHIFNLGHGIVPGTPVENVQAVVRMVKEFRLSSPIE